MRFRSGSGNSVCRANGIESSAPDVGGALLEGPPESDDLLQGAGNAVTDGLDELRMSSRPWVSTKTGSPWRLRSNGLRQPGRAHLRED